MSDNQKHFISRFVTDGFCLGNVDSDNRLFSFSQHNYSGFRIAAVLGVYVGGRRLHKLQDYFITRQRELKVAYSSSAFVEGFRDEDMWLLVLKEAPSERPFIDYIKAVDDDELFQDSPEGRSFMSWPKWAVELRASSVR